MRGGASRRVIGCDASAVPATRAACVLVVELEGPEDPKEWSAGPLPLPVGEVVADAAARGTYFQSRAGTALHRDVDRRHRGHLAVPVPVGVVVAAELLRLPVSARPPSARERWLGVVHVQLPLDEPLAPLSAAVRLRGQHGQGAALVEAAFGDGFALAARCRRATTLTFVSWPDGVPPEIPATPPGWDRLDAWLWATASGTPFLAVPPDEDEPARRAGLVLLSASWRALVLRDGIGFVARKPDDGTGFFADAEIYMRTLYTDVLLLAMVQRACLDDVANRLWEVSDRGTKADALQALVRDLTAFRNVYWWQDVTLHGIGNDVLERLHAAQRTHALFDRVVQDVGDFVAQVDAHAALRAERSTRRFEMAVAVLALAVSLPALVLTALGVPIQGVTAGPGEGLESLTVVLLAAALLLVGSLFGLALARWATRGAP